MSGAFAEALRRERASMEATMLERLVFQCLDEEDFLYVAREMGLTPDMSASAVAARAAVWAAP